MLGKRGRTLQSICDGPDRKRPRLERLRSSASLDAQSQHSCESESQEVAQKLELASARTTAAEGTFPAAAETHPEAPANHGTASGENGLLADHKRHEEAAAMPAAAANSKPTPEDKVLKLFEQFRAREGERKEEAALRKHEKKAKEKEEAAAAKRATANAAAVAVAIEEQADATPEKNQQPTGKKKSRLPITCALPEKLQASTKSPTPPKSPRPTEYYPRASIQHEASRCQYLVRTCPKGPGHSKPFRYGSEFEDGKTTCAQAFKKAQDYKGKLQAGKIKLS